MNSQERANHGLAFATCGPTARQIPGVAVMSPARPSTDWKTIIATGLMLGGLWASMNREMGVMNVKVDYLTAQSITRADAEKIARDVLTKERDAAIETYKALLASQQQEREADRRRRSEIQYLPQSPTLSSPTSTIK